MITLSVCIPTYNRAEILKESLNSLVSQKIFQETDKVEIVISDNCSSDQTRDVAAVFVAKYGDKIRYFCNEYNCCDENFSLALSRGRGMFLKLCNDTLCYLPDSLENMVALVEALAAEKPVLFFENTYKSRQIFTCGFNEFVEHVSFLSTWIGGFGLWQEDKAYLEGMRQKASSQLSQVYALLKMLADKQTAVVDERQFCTMLRPSTVGGYNLAEVFIQNYLSFYQPYLQAGILDPKVFERAKWDVLKRYVLPRMFNVKNRYVYDKSKFWTYTRSYHQHPKFYFLILLLFLKKIKYFFKKLLSW